MEKITSSTGDQWSWSWSILHTVCMFISILFEIAYIAFGSINCVLVTNQGWPLTISNECSQWNFYGTNLLGTPFHIMRTTKQLQRRYKLQVSVNRIFRIVHVPVITKYCAKQNFLSKMRLKIN